MLVMLVVVTGVPVLMGGTGLRGCMDCGTGVLNAAASCVAVLPGLLVLGLVVALMLLAVWAVRVLAGLVGVRPLFRPPQLA